MWSEVKESIFPGERLIFDVKYFGVTCGKVTMVTFPNTLMGNREVYHFYARIKSAPFYKYIYELEDYVETYVDRERFLPVKYTLIQRETAQKVDDLQLFDFDQLKTHFWYHREKKDRNKDEHLVKYTPRHFQDSFSALHFIRSLPHYPGATYQFPVVTRTKVWILKATFQNIETIRVAKKNWQAYKVATVTHYPGVLKKRGEIYFWFASDERKTPLKFMAKVKIGKVEGDLVKIMP